MNGSEEWIRGNEAYQQQERERQRIWGEAGGSSGGPSAFGQGVGNLSGWAVFFGMLGAVLGGLLGRGLMGAVVGAFLFGGVVWALASYARAGSGISRGSVLSWALMGALGGAVLGAMMGSEDSRHMVNAAINWSILGAVLVGGFRLLRRARTSA